MKRFVQLLRNRQFLFGGRILANRGLPAKGIKVTYSNCYVLKPPSDSIYDEDGDNDTIWGTSGKMAKTYAYGGGVGISLRNLRPRGAVVHNNARTTTGAVSFMPLYSLTTLTIGQEGRRGALMLSIPSSHPDLEEFIDVKTSHEAITGANISMEIDNRFMIAVKRRELYRLHFTVKDTGEVIEKYIDAHTFYVKIMKNNWDWAEPGMLFWDRISNYHLMSHHPDFYFAGTNPCAEEPLPPGGSCLLGSINLSEFVRNPFTADAYFDFAAFELAVRNSVVALNEVLDDGLELHPLKEQRETVRDLRQIGLGVMGIADMLIMMGITYGNQESLDLNDRIADLMANAAMQESALTCKLIKVHLVGTIGIILINQLISKRLLMIKLRKWWLNMVLEILKFFVSLLLVLCLLCLGFLEELSRFLVLATFVPLSLFMGRMLNTGLMNRLWRSIEK
jgi:ribonucleoside-diphosphate reductase alpha chain